MPVAKIYTRTGDAGQTALFTKGGMLSFMTFIVFMTFMNPPLGAHDIPADVLVQMLVKPEGNRLRVVLPG